MNQTTAVRSLFRNMQGNQDSVIREIFAFGIGNTGHFCLWDLKKIIRKVFACGIRNTGNFCLWDPEYGEILACGIQNTRNFCLWDPEYGTFLIEGSWSKRIFCLLDTGIRKSLFVGSGDTGKFLFVGSEILCFGICNSAQGTRNPMTA